MRNSKHAIEQHIRLPYFWEGPLGCSTDRFEKNLQLSTRYGKSPDTSQFVGGGAFPWRLSHQLEGRDPDNSTDGNWGTSVGC